VIKRLMCVAVLAMTGTACGYAAPGAGEEIVLVKQPYVFGHGGIDPEPVRAGATIIAWSTKELRVDMQPRTFVVHFDDMMSRDGVPLDFDVSVKMRVSDSVLMATKFGVWEYEHRKGVMWPGWFGNNLWKPIENFMRQAVRKHGMNETAIDTTAVEEIDAEIEGLLQAKIKEVGLPVILEDFTVGKANPPDSVKDQRIATAAQQQRIQTEQQGKLAEDQRKAREMARAAADNAYRDALGLSAAQFVELERVKAVAGACASGKCTVVSGVAGLVVGQ
jgi:regulator of protease activity HflC (stomatin/prohibitin superfamily)